MSLRERIHEALNVFFHGLPNPPPVNDAEQIVERMAAEKNLTDLNWRDSTVDLMKVLGEDSSVEGRQKLAAELGYGQPTDNQADMDAWLHGAIMKEIAEHGSAPDAA